EQGEPGQALAGWDALPDMDRVNALIFAFIRLPHRIPPAVRRWAVVGGECIFETLRGLFPHRPCDEAGVAAVAARGEDLWQRLRLLSPSSPERGGHAAAGTGGISEEAAGRLVRQLEADAEDRAMQPSIGDAADRQKLAGLLLDEAVRLLQAGEEAAA